MKTFNKLVRDKIPNIIISNGDTCEYEILVNDNYFKELNKKLVEELNEYLENYDINELIDIEEVIRAILDYKNISYQEFDEKRIKKANKRGKFKEKIYLKKTS